jgi:tetratricopeptide (TPR) repeat protein
MARGGTSGLVSYPSVKQTKGSGDFTVPEVPKVQDKTAPPASSPLYEYNLSRPLSYKPADLERVVSYDLMRSKKQQDLIDALDKAAKDKQDTLQPTEQIQQEDQSIFSGPEPIKPIERSFEPIEPLKPGQMREEVAKTKSVYEQMLEAIKEDEAAAAEEEQPEAEEESRIGAITDANVGGMQSELSKIEEETAEAIVGVHKTFAAQTEDKFNYYMKSAEEFLQQGQYYRAADAYTVASIYKPQDPLAHAGRAHALFASGEYMSSAYYLAAALNIFPEYVKFKIDLNAMIPDKDRLESRIADIKTWIEKSDSAELSFLLAYIYYQIGSSDLALQAINFSAQKLPDSEAVRVLKKAIENN